MAVFFENQQIGNWGGQRIGMTAVGDVSRSGNTVTVYNISASYAAAGAWGTDGNFTIWLRDGQTVMTSNTGITFNNGTAAQGFNNVSFGVGVNDTSHRLNFHSSDGNVIEFDVHFPTGDVPVAPSNVAVAYDSSTWNNVRITARVGDWGNGSDSYMHFAVLNYDSYQQQAILGRKEKNYDGVRTYDNVTVDVSNTNYDASLDGGIDIKGCMKFCVGCWVSNGRADVFPVDWNLRYSPPSPLSSVQITNQTYVNDTTTQVTLSITGGSSTDNYGENVLTQYRIAYIDDASETPIFGSWVDMPTLEYPWNTKTDTINATAGKIICVEARQVWEGQIGTSTRVDTRVYKRPAGLSLAFDSSTADSVTFQASVSDFGYGYPTPKSLYVGLAPESIDISTDAYDDVTLIQEYSNLLPESGTTYTGTVTNASLTPNAKYYLGIKARNSFMSTSTGDGPAPAWIAVYTAPNPVALSLTDLEVDLQTGTDTATIMYVQPDINISGSSLTPQYRYSIDGGTTYTNWTNLPNDDPDGTFTIVGLPFDTIVTIQCRTLYSTNKYVYGADLVFTTEENPAVIQSFTHSYDNLRRTTLNWRVQINGSFAKIVTLTIKNHTITLINGTTDTVGTASENLPNIYVPNETLNYTLTVKNTNDEVVDSQTGTITTARPIIGLVIDPEGVKRYITDIVKYGGQSTTDELCYDDTYTKFKII